MKYNVVIVGGGAAGMFAAVGALEKGVNPLIIEKMPRLGTKLLITGKGRCNITNSTEDIEYFVENMPGNGAFLYSAFYTLTNKQLLDFFHSLGLQTKTERGGRVFPVSDKAVDVVRILTKYLKSKGTKIILDTPVKGLIIKDSKINGVTTASGVINAKAVIITTGGVSYPRTGSTGDGYKLAKEAGHTIIPPQPALVPLETYEKWPKDLQGLTLKNVEVTALQNDKKLGKEFGEMLFTHFGVSGPIILTLSRSIVSALKNKSADITLSINLKPALTAEQIDKRLQRDFEKYSRKQFKNSLGDLLPKSLINQFIKLSGVNPEKSVNQITREERERIVNLLRNLELTVKKPRPLSEAIVTAGGVNVDEVDPSSMASKKVTGLYFAGEVLDIDGYTGGFNLQAAFSTGYLGGLSAAEYVKSMCNIKDQ
ncbi:MAG: hypothetical protein PWQ96_289 [Clostridia bacterium]|nr:hypothetical protein [Clostridia bacterium]